jgi:hypothetical protein
MTIGENRLLGYDRAMVVPLILLLGSFAGILVAMTSPSLSDWLLLAVPCAVASLLLLVRAYLLRPKHIEEPEPKWIVIDGSNVMHWKDGTPQIDTVREVLECLAGLGFSPGVVFDANAGYLISGQYQHHDSFGRLIGLPEDRVMVSPKGTPADTTILASARELGARIVTNDRFRDWADKYPEVREPGYLINGGYRDGKLRLNLREDVP